MLTPVLTQLLHSSIRSISQHSTCTVLSFTSHSLQLMAPAMNHHQQQPHFLMFPLMAQGHMIPTVDMARLFAKHGVIVTIVTTPLNALRFKTITNRAVQSGLDIRILELRFPSAEAGLPEGCENTDMMPSMDMIRHFLVAISMLQQPLEQAMEVMEPKPSCIISDNFLPWTNETACKFGIPRIIFHGTSCFSLLCAHTIHLHKPHQSLSDADTFVIPGLPDQIEIAKKFLPPGFDSSSEHNPFRAKVREAEQTAYGVVVNSFEALEPRYVEEYSKIKGNKVWCIGPVSLCNTEVLDKAERGNKASIDEQDCLQWLDSKAPNSVVYVCLGSMCPLAPTQLIEIALGLEASNYPFIWVIKSSKNSEVFENWLSEEKFEERMKDRGLIIKGWAPQVLILSHQAIGTFMTHCGWNSTLEGVCAGVPLITWPMFAEQFFNEKLVVQVLETGVRVGVNSPFSWAAENKNVVLVSKEDIAKAVHSVLDEGKEGEMIRTKAKEVGKMAKQAMEDGGSSHLNMSLFIEDIMSQS